MKVSIITVTYNSAQTIRDTIKSIEFQTYSNIEHIIVDGASTDSTLKIVKSYPEIKLLSEPDNGIYDAMNKGLRMATGDVVGILNSDDFYPNSNIIQMIVDTFQSKKVDSIFGDVKFVSPTNLDKVTRYYSSSKWTPEKFEYGYMPAHPSFFVKRIFYDQFGLFKMDYQIASDYELLIRFLYVHRISYKYIDKALVTMRTGGVSNRNLGSIYTLNKEIIRACKENGINTNFPKLSLKIFNKLSEFINL